MSESGREIPYIGSCGMFTKRGHDPRTTRVERPRETTMSTFMVSQKNAPQSAWHVIDAENQVLGRIATKAARLLQGKHKPTYTPSSTPATTS